MATFAHIKIAFVAIFLLSMSQIEINAQFVYRDCYEAFGTYNILSNYGANVDEALTQLKSLASTTYFNKISVGKGRDKVNALYSCRYDMTLDDCQSCVESALDNVCLLSVDSVQFYEECTVRYSNGTIFAVPEYLPRYSIHSLDSIEDAGEFDQLLSTTLTGLIADTVSGFSESSRYFATTTAEYSVLKTIYALAQCNEDLSSADCEKCLQNEFGNFTLNYPGSDLGQVFNPSCRLSYMLSSVAMTTPYDFHVRVITTPDEELTPPPMSPPNDEDLTPPPPSSDDNLSPPDSPTDEDLTTPPPFSSLDDEELTQPPSSSLKGSKAMNSSLGTREMSTAIASYFIALLCLGLFL